MNIWFVFCNAARKSTMWTLPVLVNVCINGLVSQRALINNSKESTPVKFISTPTEILQTRGFAPRCVKAELLGPEGSMIGYETKKKKTNEKNMNLTSSIFRARAPKNSATRVLRIAHVACYHTWKHDRIENKREKYMIFCPACFPFPLSIL